MFDYRSLERVESLTAVLLREKLYVRPCPAVGAHLWRAPVQIMILAALKPPDLFLLTVRPRPGLGRNFCPGRGLKLSETGIASFVLDVRIPEIRKAV